ncbi:uncharacterized protein LOC117825155 [Xyrichtys novacula]|uniref:Uncharacterized protein LOC117825155 n=1 Tax=Xyrichtys novacula TaxID=13765 RepID=A0AAV1FYI0_XYRNO|nr:uncharacterized protein LOC117825155 [Xyrichtys novacula]
MRVMLFFSFCLAGVWCEDKGAVFVYSTIGGQALLPCNNLDITDCSSTTWSFFYKGEGVQHLVDISKGKVMKDSKRLNRTSILSNCSLILHDINPRDAGSYTCLWGRNATSNIYLTVLSITSSSSITNLQLGGNLSLSCLLYTYFDAGSCRSYSNTFELRWITEEGMELPEDSRYKLVKFNNNRCNVTLVVSNLQAKDTNRKWRCTVDTKDTPRVVFLDFKTRFLFGQPFTSTGENTSADCFNQLPVSRIVLCAALPIMVISVGFFVWREDRKKVKTSATDIELHEIG